MIITTIMKVPFLGKEILNRYLSIKYLKQKFIKTNKNPKSQNSPAVYNIILIVLFIRSQLFIRSHLFTAVPALGLGWVFGAALCGLFSTGKRISLPGELWLAMSVNRMCSTVGASQETRFQFYLLSPLNVL